MFPAPPFQWMIRSQGVEEGALSPKIEDEALRTAQTEKASKSVTFISQQSKAENDRTSGLPLDWPDSI